MKEYYCQCGEKSFDKIFMIKHLLKCPKVVNIDLTLIENISWKDKAINFLNKNIKLFYKVLGVLFVGLLISHHFQLSIGEASLLGLGLGFLIVE